jgi:Flp pilus assembly protein TadG
MSRLRPARAGDDSGVYAILYAALVLVLLGTASVVIDLAMLREARADTRSAADAAVLAAAAQLDAITPANSNPQQGCKAAWQYLRQGLSSLPDGSSTCGTLPTDGTICATPRVARYDNSTWTVRITWPVPNTLSGQPNPLLADPDTVPANPGQAVYTLVDGPADGCSRIALEVFKKNSLGFAGIFGTGGVSTRAASVGRTVKAGDFSEDVAALNLLERTNCEALTTSGQGSITVNGFGARAGIIAIESSGTGGNPLCGGSGAVIHPNANSLNWIHANGADGTVGGGLIEAYAMNSPPTGNPTKVITNSAEVSPQPVLLPSRSGTLPVTRIFDCTTGVCADGGGPYITALKAAFGSASSVPTTVPATLGAWRTLPGPDVPSFACNGGASAPAVTVPVGNWYINCPNNGGGPNGGFQVQTLVIFKGGRIVTAGNVAVGTSGCLVINVDTSSCPTVTPGTPTTPATLSQAPNGAATLLYVGGTGTLSTGSQASLIMPQTFTFINDGSTNLSGGSGSALFMTTPLAAGTPLVSTACASTDLACSYGIFHKLVLWSEGTADHTIGGQSAMGLRGVLYTPKAHSNLAGQATSAQQEAQFWTKTLDVGGQSELVMAADPDASLTRPTSGVALIR